MIPSALYKMSRERGYDPVVMTPELATHTSRQVRDHVLCWDCEQKFSRNGENYVMKLVQKNGSFSLLDRLEFVRVPVMVEGGAARYATTGTEINTRTMAYFALSVMWRAAVHRWSTLGIQATSFELPSEKMEPIRKFLSGNAGFPFGTYMVVSVCLDEVSQGQVLSPFGIENAAKSMSYVLLTRGIYFRLMFDASFREICAVNSRERFVFVDDCREETIQTLRNLNEGAKVAQNLKRKR